MTLVDTFKNPVFIFGVIIKIFLITLAHQVDVH